MPTYEYKCLACGHDFEIYQKMNDALIKKCPKCGDKVKRLIGAGAGTIFKGSGFYQTDYKNVKSGGKSESKSTKPKPSNSKE
jgi:putative FmdB family regulatory protein